jgi:LPXTG-motif cell wall-anchored protein
MEMEGMEKNSSKKWIWISIGGVVIAIIGFVIRRKRKKKAEEVTIDE